MEAQVTAAVDWRHSIIIGRHQSSYITFVVSNLTQSILFFVICFDDIPSITLAINIIMPSQKHVLPGGRVDARTLIKIWWHNFVWVVFISCRQCGCFLSAIDTVIHQRWFPTNSICYLHWYGTLNASDLQRLSTLAPLIFIWSILEGWTHL